MDYLRIPNAVTKSGLFVWGRTIGGDYIVSGSDFSCLGDDALIVPPLPREGILRVEMCRATGAITYPESLKEVSSVLS